YMDVLYGIDNPLFLDLGADRQYLVKTFLPWLIRYLFTIPKVVRLDKPVMEYLQPILHDPSLIDMVAQHFFRGTPTFFALSYFSLYLDYQYPAGGTGALVDRMNRYILDHQGRIRCGIFVERVDPEHRRIFTRDDAEYPYRKMIWCADQKKLYAAIGTDGLMEGRTKRAVLRRRAFLEDKAGGDSILTVYAAVDKDPSWFAGISQAHFFYTPRKDGLGRLPDPADIPVSGQAGGPHAAALEWIGRYLEYTTYEISCPAMRDPRLAPAGRAGLIISTLFGYGLTRRIAEAGWYDEFKEICARRIVEVLDGTIYPGIRESVLETIVSTPMTLAGRTGNTDGAITGWAFTNRGMPAVHRMPQITKSIRTPIPDVYQAGQWSFSPSGLPISILTGKLAADRAVKDLKRSGKR
ncbi:MAG: NAD(P)/FAD-dependent oxidoreductase, partial [Clostridia bacterium]|nr:NAD(P)/FAD-dependent oxidoreductase [Clostridia bacterium]